MKHVLVIILLTAGSLIGLSSPCVHFDNHDIHVLKQLDGTVLTGNDNHWTIIKTVEGLPRLWVGDDDPDGPLEHGIQILPEQWRGLIVMERSTFESLDFFPLAQPQSVYAAKIIENDQLTDYFEHEPQGGWAENQPCIVEKLWSLPNQLSSYKLSQLSFPSTFNTPLRVQSYLEQHGAVLVNICGYDQVCAQNNEPDSLIFIDMDLSGFWAFLNRCLLENPLVLHEMSLFIQIN